MGMKEEEEEEAIARAVEASLKEEDDVARAIKESLRDQSPKKNEEPISEGATVLIDGLKSQPQWNKRKGVVQSYHADKSRYEVRVTGPEQKTLLLQKDNLTVTNADETPAKDGGEAKVGESDKKTESPKKGATGAGDAAAASSGSPSKRDSSAVRVTVDGEERKVLTEQERAKVKEDNRKKREEMMQETLGRNLSWFLDLIWHVVESDIDKTLQQVTKLYLYDVSVPWIIRIRRALALQRLGRIFMDIASSGHEQDEGLSDLERIKRKVEEALMHSVQKSQKDEDERGSKKKSPR